jgi:hypothetical protein
MRERDELSEGKRKEGAWLRWERGEGRNDGIRDREGRREE